MIQLTDESGREWKIGSVDEAVDLYRRLERAHNTKRNASARPSIRPNTLKSNVIQLAVHHKLNCRDENCGISTFLLLKLAEQAGIVFTEEERKAFI